MFESPIRSRENFLVFAAPLIEDCEIQEVIATLKSGWLGTGPKTAQFERDFGCYQGAPHTLAVNSCTAALHLSLLIANIKPGDEVITTPLTFCATVNTIIHAGGTPVLADIDPVTMNIDPKKVEQKITRRTRAIIPVHFAGRSCDMDALCALAERYNLKLIEDCAHAIETEYKGRKAGTFGFAGCFSFYVTKNVVTGEGGMLLVEDAEDAQRARILSLHGMNRDAWKRFGNSGYKHYDVVDAGFKYNMTDLQSAIGIHQLQRVEKNWLRREQIWERYTQALASLPLTLPAPNAPNTRHAYHLYTILVDEAQTGISRDDFLEAMVAQNIGVGVHYQSLPQYPYYRNRFGWRPEDYPMALSVGQQTVSLPLSAKMTDADVEDVIAAVRLVILRSLFGSTQSSQPSLQTA
jgi:dTDP-4-amino-4,6-dideoxygalactose transaminase